jgi:hypothetical protein
MNRSQILRLLRTLEKGHSNMYELCFQKFNTRILRIVQCFIQIMDLQ